jgi:hypothetical protein
MFAAMLAAREGMFFRDLLATLGLNPGTCTTILTDSKTVLDLTVDPVAFKKTKHIMRACEFVRDLCARMFFVFRYVPGEANFADIMTKPVARSVFVTITRKMDAFIEDPNLAAA